MVDVIIVISLTMLFFGFLELGNDYLDDDNGENYATYK